MESKGERPPQAAGDRCGYEFVLTFHGVGTPGRSLERGEEAVWLSLEDYEAVLDIVATRVDVRLTFDDGNESDLEIALRPLRARGLRAEFFICAGRIGRPGFLDATAIQDLLAAGMSVGSHGMDHRSWTSLGEADLQRELVESRRELEAVVGAPLTRAACPFGAYDRRVLRRLSEAGYERVYTSDGGPSPRGAWLQARTTLRSEQVLTQAARLLGSSPTSPSALLRRLRTKLRQWL